MHVCSINCFNFNVSIPTPARALSSALHRSSPTHFSYFYEGAIAKPRKWWKGVGRSKRKDRKRDTTENMEGGEEKKEIVIEREENNKGIVGRGRRRRRS